jgi:hypothetical protein
MPGDQDDDVLTPDAPAAAGPPRNADGTFAAAPEPPQKKHPDWLYTVATDLGIPPEECDELSSAALGNAIRRARRYEQSQSRQASRDDARMEAHAGSQTQPHNEPAAPEPDPFDISEIEGQLDPKFRAFLHAVKEKSKEVDALKAQLAAVGQREQQRELQSNAQMLDGAFEAIGEKFADVFGEGDAGDLGPEKAAEMKRRLAVVTAAVGGMDIRTLSRRQLNAKIKEAADMIFGDLVGKRGPAASAAAPPDPYAAAVAPSRPAKPQRSGPAPRSTNRAVPTEEDWEQGALAVPTQRRGGAEPNGRAKAIRNVQEILRQGGDGATDAEIDDGLLD